MTLADGSEALQPPRFLGNAIEGADATFGDGEVRVQDEGGVDFHPSTEAGTGRAGALRGVKGEKARLELGNKLIRVKFAGVALREGEDFGVVRATFNGGGVVVDFKKFDNSLAEFEGLLNRAGDTRQ